MFTLPSKTTRAIVAIVLALMIGGSIAGGIARAGHSTSSPRVVLVPSPTKP